MPIDIEQQELNDVLNPGLPAPAPAPRFESASEILDRGSPALTQIAEESLRSFERLGEAKGVIKSFLYAKLEQEHVRITGEWFFVHETHTPQVHRQLDIIAKELAVTQERRGQLSIELMGKIQSLLSQSRALERLGFIDTALDLIYDHIDELFRRGHFALCDALLLESKVDQCSVDVLIALLTATLPAADKLSVRPMFYASVASHLKSMGEDHVALLDGLQSPTDEPL